jgi:TnpA family transposase
MRSGQRGRPDATYVLGGLLYHESDLRIEEHYTGTAGFTGHVFAFMHMLGFSLCAAAPRPGRDKILRAQANAGIRRPETHDRQHSLTQKRSCPLG